MKKLTQEEVINKCNEIHNFKYDYSLFEYVNTRTKIKIICKENGHGVFEQTLSSHLYNKNGCPKCIGRNRTHDEFVQMSNEVHGQYTYPEKYINSITKIKINCGEEGHGDFYQTPHLHLLGNGCPKCIGRNRTHDDFVRESNKIHGQYTYPEKYINSNTKIKINCSKEGHGEFEQRPNDHLNGHGCPKCIGRNKTHDDFVRESNKIHGQYTYPEKYINSNTKIRIVCPIHNDFYQSPNSHLCGQGCPECGGVKKHTFDNIKKIFNIIHNYKYTYNDNEYINNKSKIKIICPLHGEFEQRPNDHLNGHGCPNCYLSKGETKIESYLKENNIVFIKEQKFDECIYKHKYKLRFDFYLPDYNICIEYDGKQHFKSIVFFGGEKELKKTQIRDKIKNEYCLSNNIRLIRIPYKEFNYIEDILKRELEIK